MCNRYHQLNVTTALTTYLLLCYLYTTTIADIALITNTLILSAMALIVLCGAKDTLAEETVTLRLVGSVIYGFRFKHLAIRIRKNLFGRCQTDCYFGKVCLYLIFFLKSHILISFLKSDSLIQTYSQSQTTQLM